MALKSSKGKLYILLAACLPDNSNISRALQIEEITESKEYRQIFALGYGKEYFSNLFSKNSLSKLSSEVLTDIAESIKLIPEVVSALVMEIEYGDAWNLTSKDKPNFYSQASVLSLRKKIAKSQKADRNITNISKDDFMAIFDEKTIKDVRQVISNFTLEQLNNVREEVPKSLKNFKYCISYESLNSERLEIEKKLAVIDIKMKNIIKKSRRIIVFKVLMVLLVLVLGIAMLGDYIFGTSATIYVVGIFVLSILFLFLG